MKAILTIQRKDGEKTAKERMMFDTEKSRKLFEVKNDFGFAVEETYISRKGIIFTKVNTKEDERLKAVDQEMAKEYIGENYPEIYIELFGEVGEA